MPSRKKAKNSKGRRYTIEEKTDVLSYVDSVNAERGRGGQTAAAKKFGISLLTLSNWIRSSAGGGIRTSGKSTSMGNTLAKLATLHAQIEAKESELANWKQEFDRIKRSI